MANSQLPGPRNRKSELAHWHKGRGVSKGKDVSHAPKHRHAAHPLETDLGTASRTAEQRKRAQQIRLT